MESGSIIRFPEIQELVLSHLEAPERKKAGFVCQEFYATVCHLERGMSIGLTDWMMLDDQIFESIMQSNRRFGEIKTYTGILGPSDHDLAAQRFILVVQKFKKHMKSLKVMSFPRCSDEAFSKLVGMACEMEKFALYPYGVRPFIFQNKYNKLKHLEALNVGEINAILDNIPDDSLTFLSFESINQYDPNERLKEDSLQSFVDRQKKLKTLNLPRFDALNLDHLVLEQLEIYTKDDEKLAETLKKQPALRRLRGCSQVGKLSFEELRKMPNLEHLEAHFTENLAGELTSLEKLAIYRSCFVPHRLVLPNLKELMIEEGNDVRQSPTNEQCRALRRNSPNLRHISLTCCPIDFLPFIIESFPKLKALFVCSYDVQYFEDEDNNLMVPSRENRCMEELVIEGLYWPGPTRPIYDTINACPKLKRIQLSAVPLSKHQILGVIRHHPHLTHFRFEESDKDLFGKNNSKSSAVDRVLKQIIRMFMKSPAFTLLIISRINDCDVEKFLAGDADQVIVTKIPWHRHGETLCYLELEKKSNSTDPFKNFQKKYELVPLMSDSGF